VSSTSWVSAIACAACRTEGLVLWSESGNWDQHERCVRIAGPFKSTAGHSVMGHAEFTVACARCGAQLELGGMRRPTALEV
jgi:hypothetical protein